MVQQMVKQITFTGFFGFSGFNKKKRKRKFKNAHTRILRGGGHPLYMHVASVGIAKCPQIRGCNDANEMAAHVLQHFFCCRAVGVSSFSAFR